MPQPWWKAVCQPCRRRAAAPKVSVCPFSGQSSSDGKCPFAAKAAEQSSSSTAPAKLDTPLLAGAGQKEPAPAVVATPTPAKAPAAPAEKPTVAKPASAKPAADKHLQRAEALLAKKDFQQAWEEYDRVIALDSKCEAAYLGKVKALRALNRLPKAYSTCRGALEHLPSSETLKRLGEEVRAEYQSGKQGREERFKAELQAYEETQKAAAAGCPASSPVKDPRTEQEVKRQLAEWMGRTPAREERQHLKESIISAFREQYERLGKAKSLNETATSQYAADAKGELQIKGGHRPMPRPKFVELPSDFRQPVGVLSVEELSKYNCRNQRQLISVFGDIFDVSDRPDKYGTDGPYNFFAGTDITWGLVSGKDTVENANRFYDVWKVSPEEYRNGKLQGLCSWRAFYEVEYGKPVGRLDVYEREHELPPPPMEEAEGCVVM